MSTLNPNWITEKHIDFEYKKYMLLAYLQHVNTHFTEHKLYPTLAELVTHYKNVVTLRENKKTFYERFPQRMSAVDFSNFKIIYEKILEDDELMQHVEEIISFSIPQFEKYLSEGKKIYDFLESHLEISPVGIVPLHNKEGYLFLTEKRNRETRIYEYAITLFESPDEKYRGIYTNFVCSYEKSISNTFENIKSELITYHQKLPNPAAYVIEAGISIPVEETFLPLAKRVLMKYVSE
ncbi:MAG: hypothetical protein IPJ79_04880 [Bacteroidetes bacterium]|nr:hypothetical protein [Bacteroidota bacterium]HNR18655.1 hypothetical protein [Bacteroidia bacterium]HNU33419.1 hypothetical protein [Bacteroidia bacterium]